MSNYVSNRVICKKSFFNQYFLNPNSLGEDHHEYCKGHKYISFNRLFKVKHIGEYSEKYGEHPDYGYFYCTKELDEDYMEFKFQTRWYYPIHAIKKAIEMDHSLIWYAVEENIIYISKFEWDKDKVVERTFDLNNDDFNDWFEEHEINGNMYDSLHDADDSIWYYDYEGKKKWIIWPCDDLIQRYTDHYPAREYMEWYENYTSDKQNG